MFLLFINEFLIENRTPHAARLPHSLLQGRGTVDALRPCQSRVLGGLPDDLGLRTMIFTVLRR
jgi:hypothetical protein